MGTVFGFVGSEISSKMEVLDNLRSSVESDNFSTMKKMVEYEIVNGRLQDSTYVSGSRTILRLHRGLDIENNESHLAISKLRKPNRSTTDNIQDSSCYTFVATPVDSEFLKEFLKRIGELQPNDKTSTIGQDVYRQTLGKYHPWLVRKGAVVAMYVLPTRDVLLHRVCGNNAQSAIEAFPAMLDSTNEVYNRTELYFKEKDLLNLP